MCDNCEMILVKSGRLRDHIDELHGHSKSTDETQTWQRNQATPKLHHSQIKPQVSSHSRCPLHSSSLVATSRGDQGTKKPSGNNSHTPLIVVPNLGVDVVAERPSIKDPNGGIGEKERL